MCDHAGVVQVRLATAVRAWFAISLQTFGGPAGQIAVMHRELVDERRWVSDDRFVRALSFCTMLPGPEAHQLAVYLGWMLNGTLGALIAGSLFVLPGYVVMMALSAIYAAWGSTTAVVALFAGLGPAVVAVVAQAVHRLATRTLTARWSRAVAIGSFVALFAFAVPFPFVIAVAAVVGVLVGRAQGSRGPTVVPGATSPRARPDRRRSVRIVASGLALWAIPVIMSALIFGRSSVFVEQGAFFAGTAVITFGGAYAVLSFVAQRAVDGFGWLAPGEMVHGLALAESTPGPLIMVLQFVAFLGAYRDPGSLSPWAAAVIGATITVWVTFVPSFVFVLVGAPYIEMLRPDGAVSAALRGVSAAVVGVVASLAVFFATHTVFDETRMLGARPFRAELPVPSSVDLPALAVTVLAALLVVRFRWGVVRVLPVCAVAGTALHLLAR
jgi:chromate transporter